MTSFICARIRPVGVENRRDASDVSRRRVARHEMLNQKLADKRRDVRMIVNIIERLIEALA
jgi:hypothetical protein